MIDINEQIETVEREVRSRNLEAGEAKTVVLRTTLAAGIDEVWEACTSAESIPNWFLPVSGDLSLGGRFQLEGNAGGVIEECDPPNNFTATWEFSGKVSWIELQLTPVKDNQTRLELEHIAVIDDYWTKFGPGAAGVGWEMGITGLAEYLQTGQSVDQEAAMEWMSSDEGQAFITLSSEEWGEAHIASGEDEEAAREAVERTTAFYTGG